MFSCLSLVWHFSYQLLFSCCTDFSQQSEGFISFSIEGGYVCFQYRLRRWNFFFQPVFLFSVFPKSKTQMRTCSQSRASYIANHLSLTYPSPGFNAFSDFGHVKVLGSVGTVMFDFHIIPICSTVSGLYHGAVTDRSDFSSGFSRVVCSKMGFVSFLNGMETF